MIEKFLFETTLGDWLLVAFERMTGLAIVTKAGLDKQVFRNTRYWGCASKRSRARQAPTRLAPDWSNNNKGPCHRGKVPAINLIRTSKPD